MNVHRRAHHAHSRNPQHLRQFQLHVPLNNTLLTHSPRLRALQIHQLFKVLLQQCRLQQIHIPVHQFVRTRVPAFKKITVHFQVTPLLNLTVQRVILPIKSTVMTVTSNLYDKFRKGHPQVHNNPKLVRNLVRDLCQVDMTGLRKLHLQNGLN